MLLTVGKVLSAAVPLFEGHKYKIHEKTATKALVRPYPKPVMPLVFNKSIIYNWLDSQLE